MADDFCPAGDLLLYHLALDGVGILDFDIGPGRRKLGDRLARFLCFEQEPGRLLTIGV